MAQSTNFSATANPSSITCGSSSTLAVTNIEASFTSVQVHYVSKEYLTEFPGDECNISEFSLYFGQIGSKYYYLGTVRPSNGDSFAGSYGLGNTLSELESSSEEECDGSTYTLRETYEGGLSIFVNIDLSYSNSEASISWSNGLGTGNPKVVSPIANTTYSVTVNPEGAAPAFTRNVSVNISDECDRPSIITLSGSSVICSGGVLRLIAQPSSPPFTYRWYKDGSLVQTSVNNVFPITEPGSYQVSIAEDGVNFGLLSEVFEVEWITPTISIMGEDIGCEFVDLTASVNGHETQPFNIFWFRSGSYIGSGMTYNATVSGQYVARLSVFIDGDCGTPLLNGNVDTNSEPGVNSALPCYSCNIYSDTLSVIVENNAFAGDDDHACSLEYGLSASGSIGSGIWRKITGPGDLTFSNTADPNASVAASEPGIYEMEWDVGGGQSCENSTDIVEIDFRGLDFDIFVDNPCPTLGDPVVLNIIGGNPAVGWDIDWGDGTFESTNSIYLEHYYAKGEYTITVSVSHLGCEVSRSSETIVLSLCTSTVSDDDVGTGRFKMDKLTGGVFYERDDCSIDIPFNCLVGPAIEIPRVITASTSTVADYWPPQEDYVDPGRNLSSANIYETSLKGKWRPQEAYTYNTAALQRDKNYNTGTYGLKVFNRQNTFAKLPAWIRSSNVLRYSPNGDALEEVNALDIPSTAKFGYRGALPYLTAQNAAYNTVLFESFETDYDGILESGLRTSAQTVDNFPGLLPFGHSGLTSLVVLPGATDGIHLETPLMTVSGTSSDIIVQAWVKEVSSDLNVDLYDESGNSISSNSWAVMSRSGEWGLASVVIPVNGITQYRLRIYYDGDPTPGAAIDDIRVQPLDSEMNCYVYDPITLRLLAVFDDQHFGLYYQYNEEGKLIRKRIETERGVKTIQETFYNSYNE